jgi:hypothetical protein
MGHKRLRDDCAIAQGELEIADVSGKYELTLEGQKSFEISLPPRLRQHLSDHLRNLLVVVVLVACRLGPGP